MKNKFEEKSNKDNNRNKRKKPVVFIKGDVGYYSNNIFQQNMLLKGLQVTTDVKELKKISGLKTVSEVYRTLDKLAMRREFHEALSRQGVSLDKIVEGIKKEGEEADSAAVRLKAWQVLLKSLGLDEYRGDEEGSSRSWEDILQATVEKEEKGELPSPKDKPTEYDVSPPEVPDDIQKNIEEEEEEGKKLYE